MLVCIGVRFVMDYRLFISNGSTSDDPVLSNYIDVRIEPGSVIITEQPPKEVTGFLNGTIEISVAVSSFPDNIQGQNAPRSTFYNSTKFRVNVNLNNVEKTQF